MIDPLSAETLAWIDAKVRTPGEGEWVLCYWLGTGSWPPMFAVAKRIGREWEGPNRPVFTYRAPRFWRELPEAPT